MLSYFMNTSRGMVDPLLTLLAFIMGDRCQPCLYRSQDQEEQRRIYGIGGKDPQWNIEIKKVKFRAAFIGIQQKRRQHIHKADET